jgi:hypothetical protein
MGSEGSTGFCNVTIPKNFLRGNPWTIMINGIPIADFIQTENATHSFLYFTYIHGSTLQVIIQGTWAIPEFRSTTILSLFMLTTLIVTVLLKKKIKPKSQLH